MTEEERRAINFDHPDAFDWKLLHQQLADLRAGNGLINAQLQQSTRFLANSMRVFPGETSKAYKGLKEGRSITLNDRDILISNQTYGQYVDDVGGRLEQYNVNINYGDNYVASQSLVGVAPTHPKIDKTEMIAGRFINEIDMKEQCYARRSIRRTYG